jgi:hypothetical protein
MASFTGLHASTDRVRLTSVKARNSSCENRLIKAKGAQKKLDGAYGVEWSF